MSKHIDANGMTTKQLESHLIEYSKSKYSMKISRSHLSDAMEFFGRRVEDVKLVDMIFEYKKEHGTYPITKRRRMTRDGYRTKDCLASLEYKVAKDALGVIEKIVAISRHGKDKTEDLSIKAASSFCLLLEDAVLKSVVKMVKEGFLNPCIVNYGDKSCK